MDIKIIGLVILLLVAGVYFFYPQAYGVTVCRIWSDGTKFLMKPGTTSLGYVMQGSQICQSGQKYYCEGGGEGWDRMETGAGNPRPCCQGSVDNPTEYAQYLNTYSGETFRHGGIEYRCGVLKPDITSVSLQRYDLTAFVEIGVTTTTLVCQGDEISVPGVGCLHLLLVAGLGGLLLIGAYMLKQWM